MDTPDSPIPDVQILSIEFSEGYEVMDVAYVERRNVGPKGYKRESVTFDTSLLDDEEFKDVIESLNQFLDAGLRHIREEGGSVE